MIRMSPMHPASPAAATPAVAKPKAAVASVASPTATYLLKLPPLAMAAWLASLAQAKGFGAEALRAAVLRHQ
jgi:hypothetical protein